MLIHTHLRKDIEPLLQELRLESIFRRGMRKVNHELVSSVTERLHRQYHMINQQICIGFKGFVATGNVVEYGVAVA